MLAIYPPEFSVHGITHNFNENGEKCLNRHDHDSIMGLEGQLGSHIRRRPLGMSSYIQHRDRFRSLRCMTTCFCRHPYHLLPTRISKPCSSILHHHSTHPSQTSYTSSSHTRPPTAPRSASTRQRQHCQMPTVGLQHPFVSIALHFHPSMAR